MSFWARGSPDSVQRRRLLMPQFFSTERVKARSISTFCWMCLVAVFVELLVFESFGEPRGVEAEVDADVAVLFEGGVVELGTEAEDLDGGGLGLPERVERDGFELRVEVDAGERAAGDRRSRATRASSASRTRRPCRRGAARWPRRRRFR